MSRVFIILAEIEMLRRDWQQTNDVAQRALIAGQIAGKLEELRALQAEAGKPDVSDIMDALSRFAVDADPVHPVQPDKP